MIQEIVEVVTSLGFPVAMCMALFWYMIKQNELHQNESREMRDAIESLKIAIVTLTERMFERKGDNNEDG